MNDAYKKVIAWYLKRPKWQKIVFFVFIAFVVGFLFLISLAGRSFLSSSLSSLKTDKKLEELVEKNFEEHKKETEKESIEIDKKLEVKEETQKWIEEEESKEMENARNAKKEIDNATSFDDIDRAVQKHFGQNRKT